MSNFIKTTDPDVAKDLKGFGFTELPKEGKFFCFINDGKMQFSAEDKKKVVFTNKMCM